MKMEYYVIKVGEVYVKNTYGKNTYCGSTYIYVVPTPDITKAKNYKTLRAASKIRDKISAYFEMQKIDAKISIYRVEMNIAELE